MRKLIVKSDGVTPTKSKVHAYRFLEKIGLSKSDLIEEAGQFYYEEAQANDSVAVNDEIKPAEKVKLSHEIIPQKVTWETPVFNQNNERTKLFIPSTDIEAVILGKHPAGQSRINKSAFEINIGDENFIMSLELISKIFRVKG